MAQTRNRFALKLVLTSFLGSVTLIAECFPVRAGNPEGNYIVPGVMGDVVYRRYGQRELSLDAYIQKGELRRPAVVVVHGGGWISGSRITYVPQLLELFTQAGFNWFSVDYRLGPPEPRSEALDDVRAALEFIRCNADSFSIDPQRLALVGEDTGAYLSIALAAERPSGIQAVVSLGGVFRTAEAQLATDLPPTLLIHGTADSEVTFQEADDFCESVRQDQGSCVLIPVERGIHRMENWVPAQWDYKPRLVDWLKKQLKSASAPGEPYSDSPLRKNIVYGRYQDASGMTRDLLMDAYIPPDRGLSPAVIIAHGGGWEAGDKVTYITPILEPLARAGFAWFSIDYRLTPDVHHSRQLDDLRRAIRFVRYNAARFQVDPDRIAILGESASGQMVVQAASRRCDGDSKAVDPVDRVSCRVQAVVSLYGVYDFLPLVQNAGPRSYLVRLFGLHELNDDAREVLRQYSPLYHVHPDMPPLLLIHGTAERLWEQALRLQEKLEDKGAPYELIRLAGAPHGMENWEGHPEWQHYKERMVQWLKRALETEPRP